MNPTGAYLAIFLGGKESAKMGAWLALPEADPHKREQEGIAAWHAWAEKHKAEIVTMGGPLGKTKRVSSAGIEDISNALGAFTVVRATSAEEAAKMFESHPHFAIFPGDSVEVMPVLSIPGV
jgi:phosphoketolase